MSKLGLTLRDLRKERKMTLIQVSKKVGVDVAILSKIERGERQVSKAVVQKLASLYKVEPDPLIVSALNEQLLQKYGQDDLGQQAIAAAEQQVAYRSKNQGNRDQIIAALKKSLANDTRVEAAWIYGSFARKEDTAKSDIDIMVRFAPKVSISLFDMIDIQTVLESATVRKIDLVEEGTLMPFAHNTAVHDLKQIK